MPKPADPKSSKTLSHFDSSGRARMVDVSHKSPTRREATASAFVELSAAVLAALPANPKGNPLEVARFAGIQAAKQTSALIPMCHPLPLSFVDVVAEITATGVQIRATVATTGPTGVEMEALTAASVAALTIYDMTKALDKSIVIRSIQLESVAQTPPMGWNSWNYFAAKVDDKGIRAAADQIVATGMKDAGYIYVNIDDTWEGRARRQRSDPHQREIPRHEGSRRLRPLQGPEDRHLLRPRNQDLRRLPGSLGHEEQDAKMYAGLGHRLPQVRPLQLRRRRDGEAGSQRQSRADEADDRRLRQDGQSPQGRPQRPAAPSFSRSASTAGMQSGSGRPRSAATSGAPPETSRRAGKASTTSPASSRPWKNTPAPATGTIPTCSKSATASYARRKPHPLQLVGHARRAAAGRQRPAQHEA
jgi:cyclic pyranopterin phosphate synthase